MGMTDYILRLIMDKLAQENNNPQSYVDSDGTLRVNPVQADVDRTWQDQDDSPWAQECPWDKGKVNYV